MKKLTNYKSYKNADYIYSLSNKELIDYYNCYGHHHFSRKFCKCDNIPIKTNHDCPCTCEHGRKHDHFCTGLSLNSAEYGGQMDDISKFHSPSITVCENYAPSFTLKNDQLTSINKDINLMRKSKALMKKNLEEIDQLIKLTCDSTEVNKKKFNDSDEVERFYRSDKFIGSSMNIKSLANKLPRNDIRSAKYVTELKELALSTVNLDQLEQMNSNSIYAFRTKDLFTDRDLLERKKKLQRPKVDPLLQIRPKTAVIHQSEI
jgi:hypothetical protein